MRQREIMRWRMGEVLEASMAERGMGSAKADLIHARSPGIVYSRGKIAACRGLSDAKAQDIGESR